jgi:flagellin
MLSLHTSSSSLAATNAFEHASRAQSVAATRLSTGYRINSAMDDAAGLQIATRLASQMSGTQVAMRNVQNGISLMQVTDGALDSMTTLFSRMHDLAIQAADASSTHEDKLALQTEFTEMYRQAWQVRDVRYNGEQLMVSHYNEPAKFATPMSFQIGADQNSVLKTDFNKVLYLVGSSFRYSDPTDTSTILTDHASQAIQDTSEAIEALASARSIVGSVSNRLDSAYRSASNLLENTTVAHGRITDTDFASESAQAVSGQMLMQSSAAMLKQSDKIKQLTLSLLQ